MHKYFLPLTVKNSSGTLPILHELPNREPINGQIHNILDGIWDLESSRRG